MGELHVGPGQTYATIALGIAAAVSGDEVIVHDKGSPYDEGSLARSQVITLKKASDVSGYIPINAAGNAIGVTVSNWTLLSGFEIYSASTDGIVMAGGTVEDCSVHDNASEGIQNGSVAAIIRRCKIYNNGAKGVLRTSSILTLESSLVFDNGAEGVSAAVAGAVVENCTFINNNRTGGTTQVLCGNAVVRNTIASGTSTYGIRALTYDNNCSFGHATNYYSAPDAESLQVDPLFVDPSTGDYQLQALSPCVDSGSVALSALTDLLGVSYASPPSIGAYQYVAAPVPPAPSGSTPTTTIATRVRSAVKRSVFGGARFRSSTYNLTSDIDDAIEITTGGTPGFNL